MSDHYVLEGKTARKVDLTEWARWYEKAERKVDLTMVGDVRVSTVFLGLDHQWGDGPPLIFETLVFGGPLDQEMDRYSTYEEAEAGHAAIVARVRSTQN